MLSIRKATLTDCPSIGSVHSAAVAAIAPGLYTAAEIQSWAGPRKVADYEGLILTREFFVAEAEDVVIGFVILNPENAVIEAVYVSPTSGRRGVGMALMKKLEERASAIGLRNLRLNASLNAVPFYEKAGYLAQERSMYRLATGVEIACVPMLKTMAQGNQ